MHCLFGNGHFVLELLRYVPIYFDTVSLCLVPIESNHIGVLVYLAALCFIQRITHIEGCRWCEQGIIFIYHADTRVSHEDGSMSCDKPVNVLQLLFYCAKLQL